MRSKSQSEITFDRAAALLAVICTAVYDYGIRIIMLAGIAAAVSLLTERLCLYAQKKPFTRHNLDAGLCGIILLMLMPPSVPVSLLIMSCIFAIIIGRQMFGGRENPVIPAAAAGYLFAMLNNRAAMTAFPKKKLPLPLFDIDTEKLTDGISMLFNRTGKIGGSVTDWLTGCPAQPIGTCSIVLLIVIAAVLMLRRSASAYVLLPMMTVTFLCNWMFLYLRQPVNVFVGTFLTNQLLFSAIFLYSDTDFAPPSVAGICFGMVTGGLIVFFTRILYVYDAPVMLSVLMGPFAVWMRDIMKAPATAGKGGRADARKVKPADG